MAGKRIGRAELERRLERVVDWLIMGMQRRDIWQYITNPEKKIDWGISLRTLDRYISQANDRITEASQIRRENEIGRALKRLEFLWGRNLSIQDYKAALGVIRERNKLLGLNEPERHDIRTEIETHLDPGQIDRSILALSETLGTVLSGQMDSEPGDVDPAK
jgi:hypothetical protein